MFHDRDLTPELVEWKDTIRQVAVDSGLDFFEVLFEMVDYDEMNMIAAYGGFPVRYPHWRWGMQFEELQKQYSYGMAKIYELVINNDPCYAYLMRCNPLVDQKLVMSHVYGHSDFFKNNAWFGQTNRKMVDTIANHAVRINRYIDEHGKDTVEQFIDVCLSVENLIDIHSPYFSEKESVTEEQRAKGRQEAQGNRISTRAYMEDFINPPDVIEKEKQAVLDQIEKTESFPQDPQKDILLFLLHHGRLQSWQRDVLAIVRDEAYYFAPQGMTKIMNEGWASFWHSKIMTGGILDASELVDYADHHAGTMGGGSGKLNPYKLGIELFRDIERRWNAGQYGAEWESCHDVHGRNDWDLNHNKGMEKIYSVRSTHNDITFIDEFLTEDFAVRQNLYTYKFDRAQSQYVMESRDFREVKNKLLDQLANSGRPQIEVVDGNYGNRGELLLDHRWTGTPLKMDYARRTLENLEKLWGRPVHLKTQIDSKVKILGYNGSRHEERNES
ncbi:SpoVR family protein [bacterium TMED181]|nr:SpoVR family protein [Planctomycetota bacterium]OUW43338.1 MAG: SpoVR family protein [bacterium TMED181]